jgi:hypothetical protein
VFLLACIILTLFSVWFFRLGPVLPGKQFFVDTQSARLGIDGDAFIVPMGSLLDHAPGLTPPNADFLQATDIVCTKPNARSTYREQ